jgi:hypothetical protein
MDNYTILKQKLDKKGIEYSEKGTKRKTLIIKDTNDKITPSQINKSNAKFASMAKRYNLEEVAQPDFVEKPKPEQVKILKPVKKPPFAKRYAKVEKLQVAKEDFVEPPNKQNMVKPTYISPFPSTGAKASNDIEDINADYMPESNANNGTPAIEPEHQSLKPKKVKVNQEDRKRETNEPNINILNNITPASLSSPVVLPTTNLVAQQQTNIDANNTALPPSKQVERLEASKPIETQKGLNTEDTSNLNNLEKGLEQDNMLNIDNKDVLDEANMIIKNASNKINDSENVDVDAKVLTLAEKEIQNGLESDKENIENQLNKFLQTYDPNLIDYTSPDAIKQYTLLTTQLLRLLNDKVEFLPDIKKGVDQVNKVKAEINQGDNIVKQGKIEPELEKQKDQLDGIHERYVDYNGIKYLELNDFHPAMVVGALKL